MTALVEQESSFAEDETAAPMSTTTATADDRPIGNQPAATAEESVRSAKSSRDLASQMKKNMLNGATSLRECSFVVIAGQLLALNAGYMNGTCLSGLLTISGRRHGVSAFTGSYTTSALRLADGDSETFFFLLCMILSFILGSSLTGIITPRPTPWRLEPTYGPTFVLGSLVLIGASVLAAAYDNEGAEDFVFYLAAVANGIQNGLSSSYSANLIRSTHLTGTSSDIGLFVGQCVRGNTRNAWKLLVLIALALSFWSGSFVAFYATKQFTSSSLIFNAGLFMLVGIMLVAFLVHEHQITILQALLGTWHWKKAMKKLSRHYSSASTRHAPDFDAKQDLMDLFDKVDADGSGMITPDELLQALLASGKRVRMRDIQVMMKVADTDGDGVVSRHEWAKIVDEIFA